MRGDAMDCSKFQAIVAGEREDDLSSAESEGFEAHLESCVPCRESVSRAEEDLERLASLADPPLVAASAWARVDEAVRVELRRPAMPVTLTRSHAKLAWAGMAAALVMVFTFLTLAGPSKTKDSQRQWSVSC